MPLGEKLHAALVHDARHEVCGRDRAARLEGRDATLGTQLVEPLHALGVARRLGHDEVHLGDADNGVGVGFVRVGILDAVVRLGAVLELQVAHGGRLALVALLIGSDEGLIDGQFVASVAAGGRAAHAVFLLVLVDDVGAQKPAVGAAVARRVGPLQDHLLARLGVPDVGVMIGQGEVTVGDHLFGQLSGARLVLHGRGGNEQHPRQECLGRHATGIAGRGEGRRMRHAIL